MNILFFDTETTGKPKVYNASYEDIDNWPRITQLAWMLCNDQGEVLDQRQNLISPDGWEIPKEQFFIEHNMSTERCAAEGFPIWNELNILMEAKQQADVLVAHNISFDHRVIWAEFIRAGIEPKRGMHKICTMMKSTKFCNLPNPRGKGAPKWPQLGELYRKLFDCDFDDAHNAMGDVIAVKESFFKLLKLKVIELPNLETTTV